MRQRHHYEKLAGEHRAGDLGQLTLFILFMALWVADIFLSYSNFLSGYVPTAVSLPIAIVLLALAAYMAATGIATVFGKVTPQGVIRKGMFGIVRHPIYLSEIIMYLGLLLLNISLAAAVIWLIAIGFLHYISRHEEKLLLAKFGREYEQYMREVPMWLPRIGRRK